MTQSMKIKTSNQMNHQMSVADLTKIYTGYDNVKIGEITEKKIYL